MTSWRTGVAHACMAFASATWSVQNVLSKRALVDVHPVTFALLRDAAALPALVIASLVIDGTPLWKPSSLRQWAGIACGGALGIFAVEILYVVGLSLTSPTMAAVWSNAAPLVTASVAFAVGQERFSWLRLAGVVVGAGGLLVTTIWGARTLASGSGGATGARDVYGDADTSSTFVLGNVALFANIACIAVYFCMLKPMLAWEPRPPPITLVAWLYLGGTLCTVLLAAVYVAALALAEPRGGADGAAADAATRLDAVRRGLRLDGLRGAGVCEAILFAALIGGALNYALLTWASSRIGPTSQSLYSVVQIPATALIAWLALHSAPSLPDAVATAIVVVSLALSSAAHAREGTRGGKHDEGHAAGNAGVTSTAEDGTRGAGELSVDTGESVRAEERESSRRAEERTELIRAGAKVERAARYGSVGSVAREGK